MKLQKILIVTVVILAAASVLQLAIALGETPDTQYFASWVVSPDRLEDAVKLSDSIVIGRVARVVRANDLVVRMPEEPEGVDRVPTEVIMLEVKDVLKGDAPRKLFLFHTGLSDVNTRDDEGEDQGLDGRAGRVEEEPRATLLDDDPAYEPGEIYVLLLTQGPTSIVGQREIETVRVISPEGRYRVTADGLIEPVTERKFAGELRGLPVEQLIEMIRKASAKSAR